MQASELFEPLPGKQLGPLSAHALQRGFDRASTASGQQQASADLDLSNNSAFSPTKAGSPVATANIAIRLLRPAVCWARRAIVCSARGSQSQQLVVDRTVT